MEIVIISKAGLGEWPGEAVILAAIASSFVVDDVVCLENWKNRLKTRAVAFRRDFYEREKRLSEMETAWFHAQLITWTIG